MGIRNSETERHRCEIERIWRRLRARDHSSTPANYDSFTFRPTGQAAVARNPFEKLSSDSFVAPTISPNGFGNSALNPSKSNIDQVHLNQDGQEKCYLRHAHHHSPIPTRLNGGIATNSRERSSSLRKPLQTGIENHKPGEGLGEGSRGQYEKEDGEKERSGNGNYGSGRNRSEVHGPTNAGEEEAETTERVKSRTWAAESTKASGETKDSGASPEKYSDDDKETGAVGDRCEQILNDPVEADLPHVLKVAV